MKKILLNIGLMVIVAVIIGWLSMLWLDKWTRHGETIAVPAVRTLAFDRAVSLLDTEGLMGIVADWVSGNHCLLYRSVAAVDKSVVRLGG